MHDKDGITYLFCMSDRDLGYAVIAFLVIFISVPALYLAFHFLAPSHYRLVVFENINALNFLKKQDQVRLRGVEAGQVLDVFLKDGKTCVRIKIRHELDLHQGYGIIALAKGFMGDRYLEIDPGDMNAPRISANETLYGTFPLGPVEAMAYSGEMKEKLHSLIELTNELRNASAGKQSFGSRLSSITKKLDSLSISLTNIFRNANRLAGKGADILQKSADYSNELNSSIPRTVETIESIITKTRKLLGAVDSFVASSDPLLQKLKGQEALSLNEKFQNLKQKIGSLKNFINEIDEQGLKVPLKL